MKKLFMLMLSVLSLIGCGEFESPPPEEECSYCAIGLFGHALQSDLCQDSLIRYERVQASVCQQGQTSFGLCSGNICLGKAISEECIKSIEDNSDTNKIAIENLLICFTDQGQINPGNGK